MLRLLSYAVFFFLGYRILKVLFGGTRQQVSDKRPAEDFTIKQQRSSRQTSPGDDGEYIEYEEIK